MALITCPERNSEISDQAASCPKCGYPIKRDEKEISLEPVKGSEKPRKPRRKTRIGLVIVFVLIGAIAAIVLLRIDAVIDESKGGGEVSLTDMIPQERHVNLFDGTVIVKASYWRYKEFNTLESWRDIHVKGNFQASGGTGNDVRVILMTKNDFTNFTNGHEAHSVYDSGKLTVSNIDVLLPSTTQNYVLAFDNTFSLVTDKEIKANIDLIYTF
jgi:predicted nucleic acid-binding Zn ribbon protein